MNAKALIGNALVILLTAWAFGIDSSEWVAFDFDAQTATEVAGLVAASIASWTVTETIGWPRVWRAIGSVIVEIPWWLISFTAIAD